MSQDDERLRGLLDYSNYPRACALARERRWTAPGKSRVEHPKYGSVIVPHNSNLGALENAAEYWKCELSEIINTAHVWACDQSLPVVRPKEFCKGVKS